MDVLVVTHSYPPFGHGGVEHIARRSALALNEAGHRVRVFTRRVSAAPPVPSLQRTVVDDIEVCIAMGGASKGAFPGWQRRLDELFERLLIERPPDVVLACHLMGHSPRYVDVAHRWAIPVVLELHDFYTACERAHLQRRDGRLCDGPEGGENCARYCFAATGDAHARWALRTHLFRHAITEADTLIAPSPFMADYVRRFAGVECQVVPNDIHAPGADGMRASRPNTPLHLASIGAVTEHKGQHVVLEALRIARIDPIRYTLFGMVTQPYTHDLRRSADEMPHVDLKTFGAYDPALLPALLADVDLVVVGSLVWESFSIVAREALACGIPVLASRIGALPDAIRDGENGILFSPGNVAELAALLQKLNADRMHIDRMRSAIRPSDWQHDKPRHERVLAILRETVRRGARAVPRDRYAELAEVREVFL